MNVKQELIHSRVACRVAIDNALFERDVKGVTKTIFYSFRFIRRAILQSRKPRTFDGSLADNGDKGVPVELITLIRWIVQGGQTATTDTRPRNCTACVIILSQSVMEAVIWHQDLILNPFYPDPLKLRWREQDGRLLAVVSRVAPATRVCTTSPLMQLWNNKVLQKMFMQIKQCCLY